MGALDGRVAVITGAGRGLGREHALFLAAEGAKVVVNDLGGASDGTGADVSAAEDAVREIRSAGGEAVADSHDVADWEGAGALIRTAVEAFGDLHVLVNNAGILRDKMFVNMGIEDWDAVIRVHLRGHFCPARHAAAYWRDRSKAGHEVTAAIVNTTSVSGTTMINPGQANYAVAKAGIATFSLILAKELARYGVRVNAIAPAARTRLTLQTPGISELMNLPEAPDSFDQWDPANVSPVVAYLATADCPLTGTVLFVQGEKVQLVEGWTFGEAMAKEGRWTVDELAAELKRLA